MFLEIKDIHKSFGENENRVEVLKGIDINVNQGEFVVMLGPSGSGKSTLLNIIGGIEESDEGSISIEGNSMNMMNEKNCHCIVEIIWDTFSSNIISFQI